MSPFGQSQDIKSIYGEIRADESHFAGRNQPDKKTRRSVSIGA